MKIIGYIVYGLLFAVAAAGLGTLVVVGVQCALTCWDMGYVPSH